MELKFAKFHHKMDIDWYQIDIVNAKTKKGFNKFNTKFLIDV